MLPSKNKVIIIIIIVITGTCNYYVMFWTDDIVNSLKIYDLAFRLKVDTSVLVKSKDKLQRKLENYSVFHKYMEKALERGEEFHEMRDVIARYDTLTATHEVIYMIVNNEKKE